MNFHNTTYEDCDTDVSTLSESDKKISRYSSTSTCTEASLCVLKDAKKGLTLIHARTTTLNPKHFSFQFWLALTHWAHNWTHPHTLKLPHLHNFVLRSPDSRNACASSSGSCRSSRRAPARGQRHHFWNGDLCHNISTLICGRLRAPRSSNKCFPSLDTTSSHVSDLTSTSRSAGGYPMTISLWKIPSRFVSDFTRMYDVLAC